MHNGSKQDPSRKRKRRDSLRLRFRFGFALVLCIAAGCEGFGSKQLDDPLRGIHATPKPATTPSAPNSKATAQAQSGPLPPMPSTYAAPSTAPVAGGETATSETPRPLRMAAEAVSPAAVPAAGAARGAAPVPAVTVGNPEAAPAGSTANFTKPPTPPPPSGAAANIRSYEEAQQILNQHRVSWQRLDMEDGQWKFQCGVPNPSNPRLNRTYVTNRAFPDPLSSIREVITQIEKTGP